MRILNPPSGRKGKLHQNQHAGSFGVSSPSSTHDDWLRVSCTPPSPALTPHSLWPPTVTLARQVLGHSYGRPGRVSGPNNRSFSRQASAEGSQIDRAKTSDFRPCREDCPRLLGPV